MVDLSRTASRLYRRLTGRATRVEGVQPGELVVSDGRSAIMVTETAILGGRRPSTGLATASGLALTGLRATAVLDAGDLARELEDLALAGSRHLPLVTHLVCDADPGTGIAGTLGHGAVHAAAERGACVLVASNVEEAVDFALVGRRLAETALVPVVVAMDGDTARSVQETHLPDTAMLREFLGTPAEMMHSATAAQEMLFGKHRPRVPRWHDLERPLLTGALPDDGSGSLAEASREVFFDDAVEGQMEKAFEDYAERTGRRHQAVSGFQLDGARQVIVALGAAVETAEMVAAVLRKEHKLKIGVIGIRALRPFPAVRLATLLRGRQQVIVLESTDRPLGAEPPMLRELRAVLDLARENARFGAETHPGIPAIAERDMPALVSALQGSGARALDPADLAECCRQLEVKFRPRVYLGMEFAPEGGAWPKRQVLQGALRRHYPGASELGVRGRTRWSASIPADAVTVAVARRAGGEGVGLAQEAAGLMHRLLGGHLRGQLAARTAPWGRAVVDRFVHASTPVKDPGAGGRCDILVVAGWGEGHAVEIAALRDGGALLIDVLEGTGAVWNHLPAAWQREVLERGLQLYVVKRRPADAGSLREERLLGALLGVFNLRGGAALNPRKAMGARREMLTEEGVTPLDPHVVAFQAGMDAVVAVATASLTAKTAEASDDLSVPPAVRRVRRVDERVDSLPRFWEQVGSLYRRGENAELTPDPYLATDTVPVMTSSLRDVSGVADIFPAFEASKCTGCGDCWTVCPDAAIRVAVLPVAELLEAGMRLAKDRGLNADGLRPVLGKVAQRLQEAMTAADAAGNPAAVLLDGAFEKATAKMTLTEERRAALDEAFAALRQTVGDLPLARTDPFFSGPEKAARGTGEALTLVLDPESCKGCGLCVASCEAGALARRTRAGVNLRDAAGLAALVAELPAPSAETVVRAREHEGVGPMAAALLDRGVIPSMVGADGAEAGSGEKVALRMLMATADQRLRINFEERVELIVQHKDELGDQIRTAMSRALPTQDLEALAAGLDSFDRPDVELSALSARVESALGDERVDAPRLRRLVAVARDLTDLHWRLTTGAGELGASRFSLVLGPGSSAAWGAMFPYNPFSVPAAAHVSSRSLGFARGVLDGLVEAAVAEARLLRRARLELDKPAEAARADAALAALTWGDLTAEERHRCPPLFLLAEERALDGAELNELEDLLDSGLPVKLVVLSAADLGLEQGGVTPRRGGRFDALRAAEYRGCYRLQTSPGAPSHFALGMDEALRFPGPAWIRIHAPSPGAHGFATDATLARAREAVATRVFPLFRIPADVPATEIVRWNIEGNPDPHALWSGGDAPRTPADWAFGETRFSGGFAPLADGAPQPTPMLEFLGLDHDERRGRTPFVIREDGVRFRVGPELVRAVSEARDLWLRVQEGATSPVRDAEAPVLDAPVAPPAPVGVPVERHEAALAEVRREYEARLANQGLQLKVEMAQKVRGRLLTLLQKQPANGVEAERS